MTSALRWRSDERHFKVSSIVKDKAARRCPQTTPFEEKRSRSEAGIDSEANRESSANHPSAFTARPDRLRDKQYVADDDDRI